MSSNTQKEYLKKYLSLGKDKAEKKKRKKKVKPNTLPSRLTIIDDNDDAFANAVKEDLLEDEDAPQIVAVIDERPPSLQVDEKSKTNMWIPIGNNENSNEAADVYIKKEIGEDLSPPRFNVKMAIKRNGDMSPPRKGRSSNSHNSGENNNMVKVKIEPDASPPRRRKDFTPPRNTSSSSKRSEIVEDSSPPRAKIRKRSERSESPPRRRRSPSKHPDENIQVKIESDMSPPRRRQTPPPRSSSSSSKRTKVVEDLSPPRAKVSRWSNNTESPPRRKRSPSKHPDENIQVKIESDMSPPRRRQSSPPNSKMTKTLDGKTAGLQNAKQLAVETALLKQKEDQLFSQMSSEMSGVNTQTIVRDKKTGRKKNAQEEAAKELEKKKKEDAMKEKYSRWGRGLKQVEEATKRMEEDLTEMSKPLARYADDEDLERRLKEKEWEGDPMLAYIRKKKKKKDIEAGKQVKPEYMGDSMPNRFGIRPGHRWDGVDRSNGYEKKWFEIQNSKVAQEEESYKWGIEDM